MKILMIVGARPNFMKIAPLYRAFKAVDSIVAKIVHTGQHYDAAMSDIFFQQLELPNPDYFLGIGGGTHTEQTAKIMLAFEPILIGEKADAVLVVGDVNSTLACTLVAIKYNIPVFHVEAGLRSGDRTMPEEVNRIMTDSVASELYVTEEAGMNHLQNEGVDSSKIHFVGNTMIDSLVWYLPKLDSVELDPALAELLDKKPILMTMHRPANVDTREGLEQLHKIIQTATEFGPIIMPMHPRTRNNLDKFGLWDEIKKTKELYITEPLGYLPFVKIMKSALAIITDSGGIQEESTYLGVPCLTFRTSTERPSTVDIGSNTMITEPNMKLLSELLFSIVAGTYKKANIPPLWDGHTATRIVEHISNKYASTDSVG